MILVGCSGSSGTDNPSGLSGDETGTTGDDAGVDGSDGNVNDGDSGVTPTLCANPPCDDGSACAKNSDCISQHCDQARCVAATCAEPPCADGEACTKNSDCISQHCDQARCVAETCSDGVKNGDETDVDCGGSCAPCAMSQKCATNSDCADGVCATSNHRCAKPTNSDQVKNGNETGVDCGSSGDGTNTFAPPCGDGDGCNEGSDCVNLVCTGAGGTCAAPTCNDNEKNGDETGVDCGGSCSGCATGGACNSGGDCADGVCTNSKCAAPSANDKIKNGNETDVDCGSSGDGINTGAPACGSGKTCLNNVDCLSGMCNGGICVASRSCNMLHGGTTCGPNGNEDCCTSLPIAGAGSVNLDKYNITAGRFRQFVTYLTDPANGWNGNMRAWLNANKPADWPAYWADMLPTMLDNGQGWVGNGTLDTDFTGIYQELGPYGHRSDQSFIDSGDPYSGNGGCNIYGFGARTYRLPDNINARFGDMQQYSQDMLDERSLNCTTAPMLAAFCAWDGGRLAKQSELDTAWGPQTYPWGPGDDAHRPAGYCTEYDTDPGANGDGCFMNYAGTDGYGNPIENPTRPAPTGNFFANYNVNYWGGATLISDPNPDRVTGPKWADYSIFVAPPGRFPLGNGPKGHADLGGNVITATYGSSGTIDDYKVPYVVWSRSGSWQGHPVGYGYERPARYKYIAMGGRCIHF